MGKFKRECALVYAGAAGIEGVEGDMKDKAVERIVREWVEERGGADPYVCPQEEGGCGATVLEVDTYCWRCGNDVDDDVKGAFEAAKKKTDAGKSSEGKGAKKKPAEKKSEPETAAKPADDEKKLAAKKKAAPKVSGTLDEHLEKVRSLTSETGRNAWRVGMHLNAIRDSELHIEAGHKDLKAFLEVELPNLPYSTAKSFMKAAKEFEEEEASLLGSRKLMILKNVPAAQRPPLLKAAMPKDQGGKGITAEKLQEEVKKVRTKKKKKSSAGRPTESPFKGLVGTVYRDKWDTKDKDVCTIPLDDPGEVDKRIVALVVVQKSGVKLEFVPDPTVGEPEE